MFHSKSQQKSRKTRLRHLLDKRAIVSGNVSMVGMIFQHVPKHVEVEQNLESGLKSIEDTVLASMVLAHKPKHYLVTLTAVPVSIC